MGDTSSSQGLELFHQTMSITDSFFHKDQPPPISAITTTQGGPPSPSQQKVLPTTTHIPTNTVTHQSTITIHDNNPRPQDNATIDATIYIPMVSGDPQEVPTAQLGMCWLGQSQLLEEFDIESSQND